MPAIITNFLRIANADYFQNDLSDIPTYVYFGGTEDWTDPNLPDDTVDSTRGRISAVDDILGLKRIQSNDVVSVLPRTNWIENTVYDEYVDFANMIDDRNPETDDFYRFYVVTDEFNVYKCLDNNNRSESTVKPTGSSTDRFQTPDGYIWKYMFTIRTEDAFKFMTPNWIPCYTVNQDNFSSQWNTQESAVPGTIDRIQVLEGGTGYDPNSPPSIVITGNGTDAEAIAQIDPLDGSIEKIQMVDVGQDYTEASVEVVGSPGGNAVCIPILSPVNGHGSNARYELGATFKMVRLKLEGDENGVFPVNVGYTKLGLLIEPRSETNGLELHVESTRQFTVSDTITGQTSGATGRISSINKIRGVMYITNITGTFSVNENISSNAVNETRITFIKDINDLPLVDSVIPGSQYKKNSGTLGYISNREKITRGENQQEELRLIISF